MCVNKHTHIRFFLLNNCVIRTLPKKKIKVTKLNKSYNSLQHKNKLNIDAFTVTLFSTKYPYATNVATITIICITELMQPRLLFMLCIQDQVCTEALQEYLELSPERP